MSSLPIVPPPQSPSEDLPAFPTGWYALAFSQELQPGDMRSGTYWGRDLVLFRTAAGEAVLMDAYCPHLGAHLAKGGKVVGESVRCPFHGFCFDAKGNCVHTPYGRKLPKGQARVWPVIERNGFVLGWFAKNGEGPSFEIPEQDPTGYGPLKTWTWTGLRSHPQETTENSVDLGHLEVVHGYRDVEALSELHTEGPYLFARYAMTRKNPFISFAQNIRTEFDVHVHGLGYSFVQTNVRRQKIRTRHYVCATPRDGETIDLRISLQMKIEDAKAISWPLGFVPKGLLTRALSRFALTEFRGDVAQDFEIWENKRYVQPPALADGDGPVGPYRQWCRQFYE